MKKLMLFLCLLQRPLFTATIIKFNFNVIFMIIIKTVIVSFVVPLHVLWQSRIKDPSKESQQIKLDHY